MDTSEPGVHATVDIVDTEHTRDNDHWSHSLSGQLHTPHYHTFVFNQPTIDQ